MKNSDSIANDAARLKSAIVAATRLMNELRVEGHYVAANDHAEYIKTLQAKLDALTPPPADEALNLDKTYIMILKGAKVPTWSKNEALASALALTRDLQLTMWAFDLKGLNVTEPHMYQSLSLDLKTLNDLVNWFVIGLGKNTEFDVIEDVHISKGGTRYRFDFVEGCAIRHNGIQGEWLSPCGWYPIVNGNTKKRLFDKYIDK